MNDIRIAIIAIVSLLLVSSSFSVATRICRSYFVAGKLAWHDLLIFIALIGAVILGCIISVMTLMGLGNHEIASEISGTKSFQQALAIANLCYFAIDLFVKLGSLVTYLRLTLNRAYVFAIQSLQIVVVLFGVSCLLTVLLQCVPMSALWSETSGMCINTPRFFLVSASITVVINVFVYILPLLLTCHVSNSGRIYTNTLITTVIDVFVYILPLLLTWHVHTSRTNKLWVQLLFGLGTIVVVASIVRLCFVHSLASQQDLSYTWAIVLLASAVENHLAIVVACAPAIKSLISSSVVPRMRDALSSGADKLRSLSASLPSSTGCKLSAGTVPSSPLPMVGGCFQDDLYAASAQHRSISSRLRALFAGSRQRVFMESFDRDPDVESMDFHDSIPNPLPRVHTLQAFHDPPPSPVFEQDEKFDDQIRCSMNEIFFDDILPGLAPDDLITPMSSRANLRLSTSSSLVLTLAHPGTEIALPPPAILSHHPCNSDCRHLPRSIEPTNDRPSVPSHKYGQPSLEIQMGSRPISFGYADIYV